MCGIAGWWNRDGEKADANTLEKMLDKIVHRGPDDRGMWMNESTALGHQRLSILDLSSRGHQPFITSDGQSVITYNGEVYNYLELRAQLEEQGVEFRSTTDTEVVLYALHMWGPEKAIPLFNGMFGFAYRDRRSGTLVLCRDRLGIKPLYVYCRGPRVVFGSEIKALLAHPDVACVPDRHALAIHALFHRIDNQLTPYEGIESIKPGSYWKIQSDSIETVDYFDVLRDLDVDRLRKARYTKPEEFAERFRGLLSESVRMHLASDAPLATMCSGGVDSSLVTSGVKGHRSDVVAYVADVKGAVSEGAIAKRVARHLGIDIRQVDVEPEDALRLWPWATWFGDHPNTHASDMPMLAVAKACRDDGIKVVLTGEGSDELFGGYGWQAETFEMWRRWRKHPMSRLNMRNRWHRALASLIPERFHMTKPRNPFAKATWQNDEATSQFRLVFPLDPGRHLRGTEILRKLNGAGPYEECAFLARGLDDLYGHLEGLLKRNDRMGMAASVETRVPFLENNLIDFGMHTPFGAKYRNGEGKWLVKAASNDLPRDVVYAKKLGFSVLWDSFRHGLPLLRNGMVADLFHWPSRTLDTLLDLLERDPVLTFNIVSIELWARLYLSGESADELGEKLIHNARSATHGSSC